MSEINKILEQIKSYRAERDRAAQAMRRGEPKASEQWLACMVTLAKLYEELLRLRQRFVVTIGRGQNQDQADKEAA